MAASNRNFEGTARRSGELGEEKQFVIDIEDDDTLEGAHSAREKGVIEEHDEAVDGEGAALLPMTHDRSNSATTESAGKSKGKAKDISAGRPYAIRHLIAAFLTGVFACLIGQYFFSSFCPLASTSEENDRSAFGLPYAGEQTSDVYPPPSPTNVKTELFPIDVGYAGPTPTGAEAGIIATAPATPMQPGYIGLLSPQSSKAKEGGKGKHKGKDKDSFALFKKWGNLSPWYSNSRGTFGLDSDSEAPEGCAVTALHFLHRHGARYPTAWMSYGGPKKFADKMNQNAQTWNTKGDLEFLNNWTYKMGSELLTPFGRQQVFDLGVQLRMRYGYLLKNFTESNTLPVFRTESQHRMLHSALNFANGFFGLPAEDQYLQSVTIESYGFNNTLAPYTTCSNSGVRSKSDRGTPLMIEWAEIYLKDAVKRLNGMIEGYEFTIEDAYTLQQTCAYETVALGYSAFCGLFTKDEWEGFEYALDIYFWYDVAFGSPVARVQGVGYVQELVARLTNTPIETHNSSTNATLNDNPVTFPLGNSLYVDATHETVVLSILTALNLSTLASTGTLPTDHIPANRSFIVSQIAPFATNVQFQVLSCSSLPDPQIRIIVNDAPVPLTPLYSSSAEKSCPEQKDGMCSVEIFVDAMRDVIKNTDWNYDCHGDWEVPEGWETVTGDSPKLGLGDRLPNTDAEMQWLWDRLSDGMKMVHEDAWRTGGVWNAYHTLVVFSAVQRQMVSKTMYTGRYRCAFCSEFIF